MNFCKALTDCLNYSEFKIENYKPTYSDLHITQIHFYRNIVFIYKNENDEASRGDLNSIISLLLINLSC